MKILGGDNDKPRGWNERVEMIRERILPNLPQELKTLTETTGKLPGAQVDKDDIELAILLRYLGKVFNAEAGYTSDLSDARDRDIDFDAMLEEKLGMEHPKERYVPIETVTNRGERENIERLKELILKRIGKEQRFLDALDEVFPGER